MGAATPPLAVRFDEFDLDEANVRLARAGVPVAMQPKVFAVLCVLVRDAGRLVKKDDLLDAVWGHRFVSESVLKTTISFVRTALGDDAGKPRYVETVHRHGYRFIGAVAPITQRDEAAPREGRAAADLPPAAAGPPPTTAFAAPAVALPPMVGRTDALAHLHAAWRRAQAGQRQLVWIEGDAGIGKTTLIDRFAAEIAAEVGTAACAQGQCIEQYGAGEPYLPVLEALESLARRTPEIATLMRQVAPTWLVQMPWLVADADRGALQGELAGAGPERMVRELWELLERRTRDAPLLLVTEDLHWSDHGTLRLMDHFARRRGPLRLLWVASFRLTQVIAEDEHPLQRLRQELRLHRLCDELMLDPFSERDVAAYVESRVPGSSVAAGFVRSLHEHTDGLPLFVVNVVDAMLRPGAAGVPAADGAANGASSASGASDGSSASRASASAPALPIPDSLAGAIESQLVKLPQPTREVLEAASVCGMEFRAATVAGVLERGVDAVVDVCSELVRRQSWLRETGIATLPDGTLDATYQFRHTVYKHVFVQRLAAARRVTYHRRAARALERGRSGGQASTAAEIASHHALGHEYADAVRNYTAAAEAALGRYAPQEALLLTDQAFALLPQCPEGDARLELELALTAARGTAYGVVHGIAAPQTIEAFARITELCDALPPTPERALLLNSVGWGFMARAEYDESLAIVRRVHEVAERFDDPVLFVFGCNLAGVSLTNLGRFVEARDTMRRGLEVCEREAGRLAKALLYVEPKASMQGNIAIPLAQLGLADQARAMANAALERTARAGQPMARLVANWVGCAVAVRFDDVAWADRCATALEDLAATTTLQHARGPARWFRGWVEMRRGRPREGHARVREGYALFEQVKTYGGCSETLSYAAEALVLLGQWDEAEATLDEAQVLVDRFAERLWVPELLLLRARVAAGRGDAVGERRCIESALAEAQRSQALGAELKAAVALAARAHASRADRALLGGVYARITEGFDIPLCVRARALLGVNEPTNIRSS